MSIRIKKINDVNVRPVRLLTEPDTRPFKGRKLFTDPYSNVFLCAKKKSGKTSVISRIIKESVGKDTTIIVFCSTVEKDQNWIAITDYCDRKGINLKTYTSLKEEKEDLLNLFINKLEKESDKSASRCREEFEDKEDEYEASLTDKSAVCIFQTGGSLLDAIGNPIQTVKSAILGNTRLPPKFRKLLETFGDKKVVGLTIVRVPVNSVIKKIVNIISGGQLDKNQKKYNYDQIYHLYLNVFLEGGVAGQPINFSIERNERIDIGKVRETGEVIGVLGVKNRDITFKQLIENASSRVGEQFFRYDPITSNCQKFVIDILKYSRLLTPETNEFIKQSAEKIFENSPTTYKIAKGITGFAARLKTLINGAGK